MSDAAASPAFLRSRPLPGPGPGAGAGRLAEILRVDHAGELGAVHIYRGQRAVFSASRDREAVSDVLGEMEAHEAVHLTTFETLLAQRRVRPTLLTPLWRAAGFVLGAGTALLGEKAAHACTEAVESVIEEHYAGQVEELRDVEPTLATTLGAFREDELGHRDLAVEAGARETPGYPFLAAAIRMGCKAAIKISEKI